MGGWVGGLAEHGLAQHRSLRGTLDEGWTEEGGVFCTCFVLVHSAYRFAGILPDC